MSQTVGGSNQSSAHVSTTASSTGDQRASAGVKAGSSAKTESEHNKAAANASINNNIDVSTRSSLERMSNTSETVRAETAKTANTSVKAAKNVTSKTSARVTTAAEASTKTKAFAKTKTPGAAFKSGVKGGVSSGSSIIIR
jgi:hypothetical protein